MILTIKDNINNVAKQTTRVFITTDDVSMGTTTNSAKMSRAHKQT